MRSDAASVDIAGAEPALRTLGRYSLFGAIGSGGMATVHLARLSGAAGFSRVVAIKRMHPHLARDPSFVTMFTDEARVAARIRHPNVVQTLDVASVNDELFVVLEYIHGMSLSQLIRLLRSAREPVPVGVALRIGCDVLQGLHAAHEARDAQGQPLELVHRDVSPQNVIVGADGVSRVLDFGVAKALGRMQASVEGEIKGKVAYVSPEQLRGEVVGRTTDLYSAAVLVWEVLAGRQLFAGASEGAVLMSVLEGRIPSLRAERRDVSPMLESVLLRGLSSAPAQRFATAAEMAEALERAAPPASAREFAAWFTRVGGRALEKRSALVARVEAAPPGVMTAPLELDLTPTGGVGGSGNRRSRMAVSTEIGTMTPANPSRKAVVWAVAGGFGAALGLVGMVLYTATRSSSADTTADAPASGAAPTATVAAAPPAPTASEAPAAQPSTAPAPPTAPPTASVAAPSSARPKAKPAAASKSTSAPVQKDEKLEDLFGRN